MVHLHTWLLPGPAIQSHALAVEAEIKKEVLPVLCGSADGQRREAASQRKVAVKGKLQRRFRDGVEPDLVQEAGV